MAPNDPSCPFVVVGWLVGFVQSIIDYIQSLPSNPPPNVLLISSFYFGFGRNISKTLEYRVGRPPKLEFMFVMGSE